MNIAQSLRCRRWDTAAKRDHKLRRRRPFARGESHTIRAVCYQSKGIGAVAADQRRHIIFYPGAGGNCAFVVEGATQEWWLIVPGNGTCARFDPIVIRQIDSWTVRCGIGGTEDAQLGALDHAASAADCEANEARLCIRCPLVRLEIG